MLFDSLQKLKALDGEIRVYPGHGSGSAVGKTIAAGNFCKIGNQKEKNKLFKNNDKEDFVKGIVSSSSAPNKYWPRVAELNQKGVGSYD